MQINRVSFNDKKNNFSQPQKRDISFGSMPNVAQAAGRAVESLEKSKLGNRFLKEHLQFSGLNMSFPVLFLTTFGFVLIPRLKKAHERDIETAKKGGVANMEVKDVLRRDIPSIAAILYSVPLLNKTMAKGFQKKSGLVLSTNPNRKTQGLLKNVFDTIRPVKGDRIVTSRDAEAIYSGFGDYASKIDFFKMLSDKGANLGKMFKNLKGDQQVLEKMYKEGAKAGSIFTASNKDIIEVLTKAFKDDAPQALKNGAEVFENVFKGPAKKNAFVNLTKFYNSLAGAINIFVITPLILGVLIPKINEKKTQEAQEKLTKETQNSRSAGAIASKSLLPNASNAFKPFM